MDIDRITNKNDIFQATARGCKIVISTHNYFDDSYFTADYILFIDDYFNKIVYKLNTDLEVNENLEKITEYARVKFSWQNMLQIEQEK